MHFSVSDAIEWTGSACGMLGGWLVSSGKRRSVRIGYWVWLGSNSCLILWALLTGSYGIAAMMLYYTFTCVRGLRNNR